MPDDGQTSARPKRTRTPLTPETCLANVLREVAKLKPEDKLSVLDTAIHFVTKQVDTAEKAYVEPHRVGSLQG